MSELCHICGAPAVEILTDYATLRRVTSDCQPWPAGGELGVCQQCGGAQKPATAHWLAEIDAIYTGYAIYHQSGGVEQAVFAPGSGQAQTRSTRLLAALQAHIPLPAAGRWLDVGCGNGAMLRAASAGLAGWSLAGQEINDKYKTPVEAIDRVEALYTGEPDQVPGEFDVISLIHVLEHIPDPGPYLARLASKLAPNGRLVIEVPNHARNPFDLLIADHASHFTAATLAHLVEQAGFQLLAIAEDWISKELTLVAGREAQPHIAAPVLNPQAAQATARGHIAWLQAVADTARTHGQHHPFGLFGTSIAGTWLFNELAGQLDFFVDEDPARVGTHYLGCPVYGLPEIPANSTIYLALPRGLAEGVLERVQHVPAQWLLPPPPDSPYRISSKG